MVIFILLNEGYLHAHLKFNNSDFSLFSLRRKKYIYKWYHSLSKNSSRNYERNCMRKINQENRIFQLQLEDGFQIISYIILIFMTLSISFFKSGINIVFESHEWKALLPLESLLFYSFIKHPIPTEAFCVKSNEDNYVIPQQRVYMKLFF